MTDIQKQRPSKLLASDEYWTGLLPVYLLSKHEEYDSRLAEHIGMSALATRNFYTLEVPAGNHLPSPTASAYQLLQLVIDSRRTLALDSRHIAHPTVHRSRMTGTEFDLHAEALLVGGPKADGSRPIRLVRKQRDRVVEVGRSIVYAASGMYAPYVGRPAHALMHPVNTAPNIVLPDVVVGRPFRPPSSDFGVHDFRIAQAHLLTPRYVPRD